MLSYQHAYHAGNHADILKHTVLVSVLDTLNSKDKPYTFFDTHAGSGLYDLLDDRSLKTGEAEKGILRLLTECGKANTGKPGSTDNICNTANTSDTANTCGTETVLTPPPTLQRYFQTVTPYTNRKMYPGSPEIERSLLRKGDTLIISELHPAEIEKLRANLKKSSNGAQNPSVQIHNRNGWEMLNALTPPKTSRGAVLIDPSYEEQKDYDDAARTILNVNKKWSNGIILLWYPLLAYRENIIEGMIEKITEGIFQNNRNTEISRMELKVYEKDSHIEKSLDEILGSEDKKNPPRLYGSGILAINSPWKLKESMDEVISFLEKTL